MILKVQLSSVTVNPAKNRTFFIVTVSRKLAILILVRGLWSCWIPRLMPLYLNLLRSQSKEMLIFQQAREAEYINKERDRPVWLPLPYDYSVSIALTRLFRSFAVSGFDSSFPSSSRLSLVPACPEGSGVGRFTLPTSAPFPS